MNSPTSAAYRGLLAFWKHLTAEQSYARVGDYDKVFSTEAGKRVLTDILAQAGYYQTTPVDGPIDRNEGKREIAYHILNLVNLSDSQRAQLHDLARKEYAAIQRERNSNG